MKTEDYLADAKSFISDAGALIGEGMTRQSSIQSTLLLAIGMEKLLKYMLAQINPVFILRSPDFKHSAALYRERFVADGAGAVEKTPDANVLTFRNSLTRAKVFSSAANDSSQLLASLAAWRDIIAHRPTSELPMADLERMLQKDAYPLVESFALELGLRPEEFLGQDAPRLFQLSHQLTNRLEFEQRMTELLQKHERLWKERQVADPKAHEEATANTNHLLAQGDQSYAFTDVPCPACGNTAAVRISPDYDIADGEGYIAGVYAEELICAFCDLHIDDYEGLEFVGVDELMSQQEP